MITDRDPIFLSSFWTEFFKLQNVHLHPFTAYHPQTYGQIEVVNRSLECYLKCFAGDRPKEWSSWLPLSEWWYNTSFHSSRQSTLYEIVYGQKPPSHISYTALDSPIDLVDRGLTYRENTISIIKHHLTLAQERMKRQADTKEVTANLKLMIGYMSGSNL